MNLYATRCDLVLPLDRLTETNLVVNASLTPPEHPGRLARSVLMRGSGVTVHGSSTTQMDSGQPVLPKEDACAEK